MNIADRIQNLRKTKGISQEELSDELGVSRQAVSKWESEQSMPDIGKVIIMSDYFEVTTDYILKGIETEKQVREPVNAVIFTYAATTLNFIGLIMSFAVWYEQQVPMALAIGLIIMAVGFSCFGVGQAISTQNKANAKRIFWTLNIWMPVFVFLSALFNVMFSWSIAPYPLLSEPYAVIKLFVFGLVYLTICAAVIFMQAKRPYKK